MRMRCATADAADAAKTARLKSFMIASLQVCARCEPEYAVKLQVLRGAQQTALYTLSMPNDENNRGLAIAAGGATGHEAMAFYYPGRAER